MPQPQRLEKAKLIEVKDGQDGKVVPVQFNPQTLKLNFSNQWSGGKQPSGGETPQFVGSSTTKLGMELWFDVTLPIPDRLPDPGGDVRKLTKEIVFFLTVPADETDVEKRVPPRLRFQWGTFLFNGVMDSMDETIDLFSSDGVPLRASVTISLSKHDLSYQFGAGTGGLGKRPAIGTSPLTLVQSGNTLQQMAARAGVSDWQRLARQNGIENPRRLNPGSFVDLSNVTK